MAELYQGIKRANSSYVPQFVGSTAEDLKSVATLLEDRSALNQKNISDGLVTAINEQYAPGDEYIGKKIYDDLDALRNQIAESDGGFENSTAIVRNSVRDKLLTNRDRIFGLQNAKEYSKWEQQKRELGAEGIDFSDEWKGTVNTDGSYNKFQNKLEKRLDYDKQKEQFFNQMEASMKQSGFAGGKGELEDFLVSSMTGGIKDTKIENYVDSAFNRYKTTGEYDQEARKLAKEGVAPQDIEKTIKDSILATGLERVYDIKKEDIQAKSAYALKAKYTTEQEEKQRVIPTMVSQTKANNIASSFTQPVATTRDMTPKEVEEYYEKNKSSSGGTGGASKPPKVVVPPVPEGQPGSFTFQWDHLINNVSDRQAQLMSKNPEQYKADHEESLKKAKLITESGEGITRTTRPIYQDYLDTAGWNAPAVSEDPKDRDAKTLTGIVDNMKLDDKDKVEVIPTVINRTSPNANFGPNIEAIIKVNGRVRKTVNVRMHDTFDVANQELDIITKNSRYKGQDTYTKDQPFVSSMAFKENGETYLPVYFTTSIATPQDKNPFDTEVHVGQVRVAGYNADGTPVLDKGSMKYDANTQTYDQFHSIMSKISRKKLEDTYGSGQMGKKDEEAFIDEE